jgi:hypothetical protein
MKNVCAGLLALALAVLSAGGVQAAGSNDGTQHFGPFPSTSPDGGSCGQPWAQDTFNRSFSVHDNGDGTFKVTEEFTDGTFVTTGPVSPGACEMTNHHGSTVRSGITGSLRGFLTGTVTSSIFNPNGCTTAGAHCTTAAGFIAAVFAPAATFTCFEGFAGCAFNFEYDSSDQSLAYHHWQDKSSPSGEQFIGDIANA